MSTSLRRFVAALAASFVASALAQPIQVNNAGLEIAETRYFLNADFHLDLTAPLLEALKSGVSLGFLVEFELTRPRWYWFDQKSASEKLELRLAYLPLAQQYRLSSGTLHQNSRRSPRRFKRSARFTAGRCWDRIRSTTAENTSLRCACAW